MPYVLRHKHSGQVYACTLINVYDLPYYGVKFWEDEEDAGREAAEFLRSSSTEAPEQWELLRIEEQKLKLFNVKLNNDPKRTLFMDESGQSFTRK